MWQGFYFLNPRQSTSKICHVPYQRADVHSSLNGYVASNILLILQPCLVSYSSQDLICCGLIWSSVLHVGRVPTDRWYLFSCHAWGIDSLTSPTSWFYPLSHTWLIGKVLTLLISVTALSHVKGSIEHEPCMWVSIICLLGVWLWLALIRAPTSFVELHKVIHVLSSCHFCIAVIHPLDKLMWIIVDDVRWIIASSYCILCVFHWWRYCKPFVCCSQWFIVV